MYPASLNPWRKAATDKGEFAVDPGKPPLRTPITGIAFCCARAASGVKIAPKANVLKKSRRLIPVYVSSGLAPRLYKRRIGNAGCWAPFASFAEQQSERRG